MTEIKENQNRLSEVAYRLEKPLPTGKISYEEFLEWTDEDTHAEWVDGDIIMPSPVSIEHQDLQQFLNEVLNHFVRLNDLGKLLLPFQMKLPAGGPGREPDVVFVAKAHLDRLQRTFLQGPADLVVEIISPESIKRDRETKFQEYAVGGVLEYWLIDPLEQQATFYHLDESGQYQEIALEDGKYRSKVLPGFWLQVAWLWQQPLPTVEDVLLEVDPQTYASYILEKLRQRGLLPPG